MINIVIADDHQLFIDGIKSILSTTIGIAIIGEANNGLELVKLLDLPQKPDVIITDIRMPIMDGITATKVLTKEYPHIPILALSMYDQVTDVMEMIEAGAKGYIVKNTGKEEMLLAINALHQKKEYYAKELEDRIKKASRSGAETKTALSRRERQILQLIARDRTSLQIASELNISKYTVDTHRKNIHKKLGINTTSALIKYVIEHLS